MLFSEANPYFLAFWKVRKKEPERKINPRKNMALLDDVVCLFFDQHGRDVGLSRPRGVINNGIPFFGLLQEVNLRSQIRILYSYKCIVLHTA